MTTREDRQRRLVRNPVLSDVLLEINFASAPTIRWKKLKWNSWKNICKIISGIFSLLDVMFIKI